MCDVKWQVLRPSRGLEMEGAAGAARGAVVAGSEYVVHRIESLYSKVCIVLCLMTCGLRGIVSPRSLITRVAKSARAASSRRVAAPITETLHFARSRGTPGACC